MGDGLNTQAAPFRPGGGGGGGGGSGYYAEADEGMGYDDGEGEEEGGWNLELERIWLFYASLP